MAIDLLFFIIGLLMLYYGANWLVRGSSGLARSAGVRPVIIGLTVVAFGTSSPELFVSVVSSLKNKGMIAVGNVVGSNICNIALVLGTAALFQPITSHRSVIRRDIPVMLGISLYLLMISLDSMLGRINGATLFAGIIAYTLFNYYIFTKETEKKYSGESVVFESSAEKTRYPGSKSRSKFKQILLIALGICGVVGGADFLINSSVKFMKLFGVNEKFIGLTIVAFGTSLPELATSVIAAIRKEMDISIGNLVGSNVFNILSVLGAAALIRPVSIPGGFIKSGLFIDYLVMIFTSFLPWLMMRKTYTITRKDGFILLLCYIGYLVYLIVKS